MGGMDYVELGMEMRTDFLFREWGFRRPWRRGG